MIRESALAFPPESQIMGDLLANNFFSESSVYPWQGSGGGVCKNKGLSPSLFLRG